MKFFRTADAALYEQVRLSLDEQWGLAAHGCTCITPAAEAPRDDQGRIVLSVDAEFLAFEAVVAILPGLLVSGAVEEISEAEYFAALTPPLAG